MIYFQKFQEFEKDLFSSQKLFPSCFSTRKMASKSDDYTGNPKAIVFLLNYLITLDHKNRGFLCLFSFKEYQHQKAFGLLSSTTSSVLTLNASSNLAFLHVST